MKRLWIAIGLVMFLAGAAALLWPRVPGTKPAILPDGTQVIVQAATYGTNHNFVEGSSVLARWDRHIPRFIRQWLPMPYQTRDRTSEEFLIVWYSAYDPGTEKYVQVRVDEMHVVDEHGCRFPVNQFGGPQSSLGFTVAKAFIRVFPRRQKAFTLRTKFANYPPVDLRVNNPLPPSTAEWKPEPLPATRRANSLEVTVTHLRPTADFSYLSVDYDIYQDGVYRNEWYSVSRTFRDATGNSSYFPLCRFERAWKLEMDLYKSAKAPFPESAIWRLPNMIIPEFGKMQALTNETEFGGLTLRPIALCGAGRFIFSNEVCLSAVPWRKGLPEEFSSTSSARDVQVTFASQKLSLLIRVDGWRTSQELLIRAQAGDAMPKPFQFRGSADNLCRFEMENTAPGQTVHLEFIPQQPMRSEFLVEPPR